MTPDELRAQIARWEDPHTDFKQAVGATAELAKDFVCFANTDGGQVVVGVAEGGEVVGVPDVDRLLLQVDDVAFQRCSPPVTVVPETVEIDSRRVVVLHVARGDQRPYSTKDGKYYVRSGARCRAASREELLRLFQAAQDLFYDEVPLRQIGLSTLDTESVGRHLVEVGLEDESDDPARILRAWRMSDGDHPTVGGLIVFGRRPQDHLVSSGVIAGVYEGLDPGDDLLDRKDLTGNVFALVDQLVQFLGLYLRTGHRIEGFEPERVEDVPAAALREAVVNALTHRDYTIPAPTRVLVFSDRVEVHSPGRPPNSVDAEAMRSGVHVPRNPYIYGRVVASGLATRAGSGIPRIARLLRKSAGTTLGISISDAEVVLTLPRRPAGR
ncbi:RNA-binding domain-containing protein [Actinomycetospora termitidis]|uniref:DNA binding domain-containing protein n=1 Tax=Actinomycetospora termitidis TaxID=3053470 RepID=A0ABT7MBA1_9PSEU|nr:RNA-binding domain-containing protein [Actinomycetospora sp. Odt1-22]MDL5157469.1 putative DNA binding domain-containing protein [Actinomycetospora sp. Odt1-22]